MFDMNCTLCGLHKFRKMLVPGRGVIPAEVLFIGEAPGKSENVRGLAMIGPTKRIIDAGIATAVSLANLEEAPTYYITNVLACRPTDSLGGPNRQPTGEEAWACWPRLERCYLEVKPKRVVFLGKVAEQYCKKAWPFGIPLQHPAYILRKGGQESPEFLAFARSLAIIFSGLHSERMVQSGQTEDI